MKTITELAVAAAKAYWKVKGQSVTPEQFEAWEADEQDAWRAAVSQVLAEAAVYGVPGAGGVVPPAKLGSAS